MQFANAATALAALEEIAPRLNVPAAAMAQGLKECALAARFQVIRPRRELAAHGSWMSRTIPMPHGCWREICKCRAHLGRTFAVCGILADKDAAGIAAILARLHRLRGGARPIDGTRGRSGQALAAGGARRKFGQPSRRRQRCQRLRRRLNAARRQDRIVVFGSFHTVGPAIDWLEAPRIAAAGGASRIYCAPRASEGCCYGSSRQRTAGRRIDLGRARGAGRARTAVGPETTRRLHPRFRRKRRNPFAMSRWIWRPARPRQTPTLSRPSPSPPPHRRPHPRPIPPPRRPALRRPRSGLPLGRLLLRRGLRRSLRRGLRRGLAAR